MIERIERNPETIQDYKFVCKYIHHCINLLFIDHYREYHYYLNHLCEKKKDLIPIQEKQKFYELCGVRLSCEYEQFYNRFKTIDELEFK
jgi:hypothetical protein